LRDSLGARRSASDMLIPRCDLGSLFPLPAASFVAQAGGSVHTATRVSGLGREGQAWRVMCGDGATGAEARSGLPLFDAVILATPHADTERLLAPLAPAIDTIELTHEPITTCYLRYPPAIALDLPFFALRDDPAQGHWGQFVFDRGQLDAAQRGTLAVVISAASEAAALGKEALCAALAGQLASVFANPVLRQPLQAKLIAEKRATFSCTPGLIRPSASTGIEGLLRAGDHVAGDYPSTLEGAVRSGIAAADML
jgi:predicted NAD/FAD-dependent oxidoreductase